MPKELLTQFSGHANTIADTFRAAFAKHKVGGCGIEMTAPEGSTHGGLLALQHITLFRPDGMKLVVGTANAQEKRAELRAFSYVARLHEERYKKPPPFTQAEYDGFLEKAKPVLSAFALDIAITDAPRDPVPSAPGAGEGQDAPPGDDETRKRWRLFLVISVVLFVGVALLLWLR